MVRIIHNFFGDLWGIPTGDSWPRHNARAAHYCLSRYTRLVKRHAGECPEWQRGRTVNPLAYAFVGSSPTSPTTSKISS
jgi:hypothetical protein